MTTLDAPDRCAPRAIRIAQVKFVMLPGDYALEPAACATEPIAKALAPIAKAPAPVQTGAQSLSSTMRTFILRVIGRLEAARP